MMPVRRYSTELLSDFSDDFNRGVDFDCGHLEVFLIIAARENLVNFTNTSLYEPLKTRSFLKAILK